MLTVANASTFGSNVIINPDGELDDGQFEICLIEPFPSSAAPGLLYRLYTNGFDASDYTRRLCCRRARISVPGQTQVLVQVDGEPHHVATPVEVEINPSSLQVLVPVNPPKHLSSYAAGVLGLSAATWGVTTGLEGRAECS
ncbi:hypothetical protein MUN84_22330 [Hymenobacter sp. 5516J-16]|uniref:diacylglycerol/lipid kinase family protein n=1 Tax=Hymenobacter sp. 5516J-16 TaxID=2932253 RepID=UPI001FD18D08|nr:hypothetical protein [Hymenobacter sp. 5516J-16]UOQ77151.1 hypothetical protein MUN84_22330 [Hymenobacter sp. 5516J-16]